MRLTVIGEGPLVVKLAGIAAGVGLYREECEAAAQAGFRVALVDTAGDRHDDPAPGPITWDFLAAESHAALDALGARRAVLWGTSFGALVALALAARRPMRVAGLLLCHPPNRDAKPPFFDALLKWAESRRDPARASRAVLSFGLVGLAGWEIALSPAFASRLSDLARARREAATPHRTVLEKLRLLGKESPGLPPPALWPKTTIVAGRWDRIAPIEGAKRLANRMTGSRLVALPGAGHGAAWSRPSLYNRTVVDALKRITETGPETVGEVGAPPPAPRVG